MRMFLIFLCRNEAEWEWCQNSNLAWYLMALCGDVAWEESTPLAEFISLPLLIINKSCARLFSLFLRARDAIPCAEKPATVFCARMESDFFCHKKLSFLPPSRSAAPTNLSWRKEFIYCVRAKFVKQQRVGQNKLLKYAHARLACSRDWKKKG